MPNWTYNRVHGSKKICEALLGDDRLPTFKKIVPTPQELITLERVKDTSIYKALMKSLLENDDGDIKAIYYDRNIKEPFEDWMKKVTAECPLDLLLAGKSLKENYGVDSWYDFNCRYYGCKWDANSINDDPYEEDVEEIEFETPWSPPEAIMDKLAELYPNEVFTWHADEESCSFSFDRDYHGDGTYSEHDVFPEWFTPYIAEESDLVEQVGEDYADSEDLRSAIASALPDQCNYDIQEDRDAKTLSVTVYDWDQYGGDELYTHTFNGVKYK